MKISELTLYRCPKCNSKLRISKSHSIKNEIMSGLLIDDKGHKYHISDGFPIFFNTQKINKSDSLSKVEYDQTFHTYDDGMDFFYSTLGLNGKAFDKSLIDLLDLKSHHKVLEIGAGTGRHSKFIINKLRFKSR